MESESLPSEPQRSPGSSDAAQPTGGAKPTDGARPAGGKARPARAAATRRVVSESALEAMIALLGDSSEKVHDAARRGLREHAEAAESLLRERLVGSPGERAETLHEALLDVIGARLEAPLTALLASQPELEHGALLIGRLVDAAPGPEVVPLVLDGLAAEVRAELEREAPAEGREAPAEGRDPRVAALIEVLVRRHGFTGADPQRADGHDAVLAGATTRGRGLPLALCTLWLLVARRAGLPLRGMNMPGHFLLRLPHADGRSTVLDPFHGGREVRESDCRRFLVANGYPSPDLTLLDASDRDMLLRSLRNLVMIATRRRQRELAARCARILHRAGA